MDERDAILGDDGAESSDAGEGEGQATDTTQAGCKLSYNTRRLVRTCSMVIFYVTLGLYAGIMPPATLDLMELFGCSIESLSLALSFKAVGILAGSLLGGLVANKLRAHTDLALALISLTAGSVFASLLWSPSLIIFGLLLGFQGVMTGALNVVCNTVTMAEWKERSPAPMNALHMAYSLGLLLAPPTTAPFLALGANSSSPHGAGLYASYGPVQAPAGFSEYSLITKEVMVMYSNSGALNRTGENPYLFIPYTIDGGLGVLAGLLFLLYYCMGWEYDSARPRVTLVSAPDDEDASVNTTRERSAVVTLVVRQPAERRLKIIVAIAMPLTYFALVNKDNAINAFSFYIAVKSGLMHKSRAVIFQLVYNASSVFGRLMGTVLGGLIDIHYLVFGALLASMADLLLLVFLGLDSQITFLTLTCGFAVFCGPCYASIMSWADRYTEMGGVMVSLIDVGVGTGAFVSMYLGGYLLNHHQLVDVFILATASSGLLVVLTAALQAVCSRAGLRDMGGDRTRGTEVQGGHCPVDSDRQNLIES